MKSRSDLDEAFGAELEASRPAIKRLASRLSRDHATAECLVQSTLLRAWRYRGKLREPRAMRGWLLQICRREHARLYERKRLPTVDLDSLQPEQQPVVEDGDAVAYAEVRQAIHDLDEMYRVPLVLQVIDGWSTADIARHFGVPRQTILTRLFRARRLLRRQLESGSTSADSPDPVSAVPAGRDRPVPGLLESCG
ncbi:MAG: sigma-70 family RNA polymerase sigma factor [Steroidobacteraceae bacterium]